MSKNRMKKLVSVLLALTMTVLCFVPAAAAEPKDKVTPILIIAGFGEYVLVDGYNIIFAWDELNALSKESLDAARHRLMDILCNYQGYQKCVLILVFDAYRVPGSPGAIEQYHNIHVVYTKEAETADMFIERVTHEIGRNRRVRVATSDGMEQIIILGHGALRVSARMFHEEVQNVEKQIRALVQGEA